VITAQRVRWVLVVVLVLILAGAEIHAEVRTGDARNAADHALAVAIGENRGRIAAVCHAYNRAAKAVDTKLKAIIATTGGGTALDQPTVNLITDPIVRAIFQRVLDNGQAQRASLLEAVGKPLPRQDCTQPK
jgi:imidazolonepropionase-like amidohydrolase